MKESSTEKKYYNQFVDFLSDMRYEDINVEKLKIDLEEYVKKEIFGMEDDVGVGDGVLDDSYYVIKALDRILNDIDNAVNKIKVKEHSFLRKICALDLIQLSAEELEYYECVTNGNCSDCPRAINAILSKEFCYF